MIAKYESLNVWCGMFLRPPRFGKSLLLSMMHSYYDVNQAGDFGALFEGLDAARYPTATRSSFMVLRLNFAIDVEVGTTTGEAKRLLYKHINHKIRTFQVEYGVRSDVDHNAVVSLEALAGAVQILGGKLLVLVDEYDRFGNKLALDNVDDYHRSVAGTSGVPASSPIRGFFELLKTLSGTMGASFRSFTTGISPLVLADASGANNIVNVSFDPLFGDAVGLTEVDIMRGFAAAGVKNEDSKVAVEVLRKMINGYLFLGTTIPLFNSTHAIFFMQKFLDDEVFRAAVLDGTLALCSIVDPNVVISENVLRLIDRTPAGFDVVERLLAIGKIELAGHGIMDSIRLSDLVPASGTDAKHDAAVARVASFLYYHGALSLANSSSRRELKVPNDMQRDVILNTAQDRQPDAAAIAIKKLSEPSFLSHELARAFEAAVQSSPVPTMFTTWREDGFQVCAAGAFVAALGRDRVKCEISSGDDVHKRGVKRTDMMLEHNDGSVTFFELKAVAPTSKLTPGNGGIVPFLFAAREACLSAYSDEDLLRMGFFQSYKGRTTVSAVLDEAADQALEFYVKARGSGKPQSQIAQELRAATTVRVFAVVLVGNRVLVKEVPV